MKQDTRILSNEVRGKNEVKKKSFLDVEVKQHVKTLPNLDIRGEINKHEVYKSELAGCNDYRVILTIKPYCTNVLFNAVTEIVQNEGDPKNQRIISQLDANSKERIVVDTGSTIYGIKKPDSVDMVRNTEYSNGTKPFVYHCGTDIFNNHILRNNTFKAVSQLGNFSGNSEAQKVFNTIRDFMRSSNGNGVPLYRREAVNKAITIKKPTTPSQCMHLYIADDIDTITDSINNNLKDNNGWFGFYNRKLIEAEVSDKKGSTWESMNISNTINTDSLGCSFVDMYPDRTLFSFSPKYNPYQHREEHNWDITLTYPYESVSDESCVAVCGLINEDEKLNALLAGGFKFEKTSSGSDITTIRSIVKHNLEVDDLVNIYYLVGGSSTSYKLLRETPFTVLSLRGRDAEGKDYSFAVTDIRSYLKQDSEYTEGEPVSLRFVKVVDEKEVSYYYRKFRKIPNFKFKREALTSEIASDKEWFEDYIKDNCTRNGKLINFANERYSLAFSKTIYGEQVSQVAFTDTISIDGLIDNLGRPLSEVYVTILKRNKGYKTWYNKNNEKKSSEIEKIIKETEYSHCFGELVSGIDVYRDNVLDDDGDYGVKQMRRICGDVTLLTNRNSSNFALDKDITIEDSDTFFGDIVELNPITMIETTLADVKFRFNTLQREYEFYDSPVWSKKAKAKDGVHNYGDLVYDEIVSDDFDAYNAIEKSHFVCKEYSCNAVNEKFTTYRPEGYVYKPHYKIQLKEVGDVKRASHAELLISQATPKQYDGLYIEVRTKMRHRLTKGGKVYLAHDNGTVICELDVVDVKGNLRVLLSSMDSTKKPFVPIFDLVDGLNNGKYRILLKNVEIPSYAKMIYNNVYTWREVGNHTDNEDYQFANGHIYITKDISFFLGRQDPFGYQGLMDMKLFPNDIIGTIGVDSSGKYYRETEFEKC